MTRRSAAAPAETTTRQHILDATLDHLRSEGLATLTIRRIAERAGANVAAVNYHFGSKEALLEEVIHLLTAGLRGAFARLGEAGTSPRDRLRGFFDELSATLLRHPDVYRQALATGLGGDAQRRYLLFLRAEGLQALRAVVREATGETEERRLTLRVLQAVGGLTYPLLVAAPLEQAAGVRLTDEEVRREHVAVCLDALLGPQRPREQRSRRSAGGARGAAKGGTDR